ncbi:RimK/LysX family protein [Vibrio sp. ZSDE26]|uniref:RimK/LysX family protein n=1 Tax=Vibrio amylolyticus TaxID=2847292 RepID=A0A9X1XN85_9VIBR|nr:RimK/LysX family protein [Vibrio amylolyticus]MCK6264070.1 RimK/LysX family protein [Vibrio amylolyticus]
MKTIVLSASLFMATISSMAHASSCSVENMDIIGQKAFVDIAELKTSYRARVDTGATRTSLHAMNIEVIDGVDELEANIGKEVRFVTGNELDEHHHHQAEIVAVRSISNSFGTEFRYSIELTMTHQDYEQTVEVNLRDRSSMGDKLLIGRNWLECRYLVDVSQNPTEIL